MKAFIYLLLLCGFSAVAQREMMLFDEKDKPISREDFERPRDAELYMTLYYTNEATAIGKIFRRDEFGKIEPSELEQVRRFLEHVTARSIPRQNYLIINYYHQASYNTNGNCFRNFVRDKRYKRFLKEQENVSQFFVTAPDFKTTEAGVVHDAENTIGRTLFRWSMDCGSFVILAPDGAIFRHWGEYKRDVIPKRLRELKEMGH